jgi:hypothetical protein
MPKLIYHDSDGVDKVMNLGAEPMLIGRATECQIQTQDAMVSRRHARIVWDGNYWIEDLGSSNGVYVGNERVRRAPFRPGDTVTCGSLVLRLMPDTAPRTTSQANLPTMLPPAPPLPLTFTAAPAISRVPTDNPAAYRGPSAPPVASSGGGGDLDYERNKRAELETALDVSAREINALRRKVDQLNSDLKRLRAGTPAAAAEDGERAARLAAEEERDRLKLQNQELTRRLTGQSTSPSDGESQKLKRQVDQLAAELHRLKTGQPAAPAAPAAPPLAAAPTADPAAADTVILLSDALAELRASLRAANGEAALLKEPAESAQVVTDALKSAAEQLETARANVRALAKLMGV